MKHHLFVTEKFTNCFESSLLIAKSVNNCHLCLTALRLSLCWLHIRFETTINSQEQSLSFYIKSVKSKSKKRFTEGYICFEPGIRSDPDQHEKGLSLPIATVLDKTRLCSQTTMNPPPRPPRERASGWPDLGIKYQLQHR